MTRAKRRLRSRARPHRAQMTRAARRSKSDIESMRADLAEDLLAHERTTADARGRVIRSQGLFCPPTPRCSSHSPSSPRGLNVCFEVLGDNFDAFVHVGASTRRTVVTLAVADAHRTTTTRLTHRSPTTPSAATSAYPLTSSARTVHSSACVFSPSRPSRIFAEKKREWCELCGEHQVRFAASVCARRADRSQLINLLPRAHKQSLRLRASGGARLWLWLLHCAPLRGARGCMAREAINALLC
jgi:hypothetical protein